MVALVDGFQSRNQNSLAGGPSVLFIASMATLVQSFAPIKLVFISLFIAAALVDGALRERIRIYPRLIYFYLIIAIVGIIWAFIGLLNPAAFFVGITDSLRLYTLWSAAFLVLYTLLRSQSCLISIHRALVAAGILISMMNFVGIADQLGQFGIVPEFVRDELNQKIAIYDGFIQVQSRNIGTLFFLVPYLIAVQVRSDTAQFSSFSTKLSLFVCLILSAISGRRALVLLIAITPFIIFAVSVLSGHLSLIRVGARRLFVGYTAALVLAGGVLTIQPSFLPDIFFIQHIQDAFSASDERTIQKPYLVDGFKTSPIVGLGYGSAVVYQRNDERPWIYELTYYQMLLNSGVLGLTFVGALVLVYALFIIDIFRRFKPGSVIPFGLSIGVISLLLGASSNPYLGSFDELFFIGFVPFLATFRSGFVPLSNTI